MNNDKIYPSSTAEDLLKILFHSIEGIVVYTSSELHIGYVNDAMLKLWRKDISIVGQKLIDAAPEFAEFIPILNQVWQTGQTYQAKGVLANIDIDGVLTPTPFDFAYHPVLGDDRDTKAIINSATDVSERLMIEKQLEAKHRGEEQARLKINILNQDLQAINEEYQATNEELQVTMEEVAALNEEYRTVNEQLNAMNERLQENEHTLSLALEAGNLGIYDLELSSGRMECSEQCKLNFGRPVDRRFDFSDLFETILPEYREMVRRKVADSIEKNTLYNAQYQIERPDGSIHWIQANGSPKYDANGTAIRMVGVTQLITEKKNYDLRKDEFLSVASHELKTPLTALKGNLQMLERMRDRIKDEAVLKLLNASLKSMNKVDGMVGDLLEAGKYSESGLSLKKTSFDLAETLEECYVHLTAEQRIKLNVEAEKAIIEADEKRICQVIINFLNNAYKYAGQSEKITLKVADLGQEVRVSVIDQGVGIPPEKILHLFDRFWQSGDKTRSSQGLGLGLYISAEIIRRHGGQIGADSELGNGTTFWFTLPKVG
ncbi:ATP-binding protein [Pedobacter frigidisoli]|uniref:ATP-binding protein n=1 Tax=Pedobacter frigidisoli TaxID=2530455 RepID=UPI00292DE193|nr:ATP-binding protein [Pedobacter frigidisoli]